MKTKNGRVVHKRKDDIGDAVVMYDKYNPSRYIVVYEEATYAQTYRAEQKHLKKFNLGGD